MARGTIETVDLGDKKDPRSANCLNGTKTRERLENRLVRRKGARLSIGGGGGSGG